MARHIKRNDIVVIIAGKDKPVNGIYKQGKVLRVIPDKDRVVVEGINRVWKHVKPSQRYPQGGRIQKEAPIHVSNVLPLDPTTGKGTRIRMEVRDGYKHRIAIKSGTDLGRLGKA